MKWLRRRKCEHKWNTVVKVEDVSSTGDPTVVVYVRCYKCETDRTGKVSVATVLLGRHQ